MDTPLFDETWRALHPRVRRRHRWDGPTHPLPPSPRKRHSIDCPTEAIPVTQPEEDPPADTAGEEDHTDPWSLAGEDVAAPQPGEVPDGVA